MNRVTADTTPKRIHEEAVRDARAARRHLVDEARRAGLSDNARLRRADEVVSRDARRANDHLMNQFQRARENPNLTRQQVDRAVRKQARQADRRVRRYGSESGVNRLPGVRRRHDTARGDSRRVRLRARRRPR